MSEWTTIKGEIKSKKVSMKKIINHILDGEDFIFHYDKNKFEGRFEHGGLQAAKTIQKIIDEAKSFDNNTQIYIESEILFL